MKRTFLMALLGVAAGCQDHAESNVGSPTIDAEFRSIAREVYDDLFTPSCKAPPGFDRTTKLAPEHRAIREFEDQMKDTPSAGHLVIARQDADHERAANEGCWADEDPDFAQLHIEMTQKSVKGGLKRLGELAGSIPEPHEVILAAGHDEAEFRYIVRQLVEAAHPRCSISTKTENDQIMAPALAEVARFRSRIEGTPLAGHYDLAQADVVYRHSVEMVECASASSSPPTELSQVELANIKRQVAGIDAKLRSR